MDNDKFPKGWEPCWNPLYSAIKAGATPREVAAMCPAVFARFVQKNGCPGFEEGKQILDSFCIGEGQLDFGRTGYADISILCEDAAQAYAGSPQFTSALYIMQAVEDLAFKIQTEGPLLGHIEVLLAEQVCLRIMDSSFAARLDGTRVMETFVAKSDNDLDKAQDNFHDWRNEFLSLLPEYMKSVAQKLARDSSGETVTARQVRAPKRSTLELLNDWGRLDVVGDEVSSRE